jgi:hypothetical protein
MAVAVKLQDFGNCMVATFDNGDRVLFLPANGTDFWIATANAVDTAKIVRFGNNLMIKGIAGLSTKAYDCGGGFYVCWTT